MQTTSHGRRQAKELLPLVRSIGRELSERMKAIGAIEERMSTLATVGGSSTEFRLVTAEAAAHYRGIRIARQELERLGCSVVGKDPLTLRIPGKEGGRRRSFLWQSDGLRDPRRH